MSSVKERLLERSGAYSLLQRTLGARRAWRLFVTRHVRPRPGERLLDVGCGPADMLEFVPDGVRYVGVDLNPRYVETARARYGARGLFICDDATAVPAEEGPFDVVSAYGLLHHLDDAHVRRLIAVAVAHLRPGGRFVSMDPVLVRRSSEVARWLVRHDRGEFVRSAEGYVELARGSFAELRTTVRDDALRVPYTHLVMEGVVASAPAAQPHVGDVGADDEHDV